MPSELSELSELKGITFGSLNIRCIIISIDELKIILEKSKLDILLLQETLLCPSIDSSLLYVPNYTFYRADCTANSGKKGGGGLAAFVSS